MGISRKLFNQYISLLLYMILLIISYGVFIDPVFNNVGYFSNFNLFKLLEAIFAFFIMFVLLPQKDNKPSTISLNILFILMVIPFLALYTGNDQNRIFMYFFSSSFILTLILNKGLPIIKLKLIRKSHYILGLLIFLLSAYTYGMLIRLNGAPSLSALNLLEVYDLRESVNYGGSLLVMLSSWQARIINSFLLLVAYEKKNRKAFLIIIILQIIQFLYVGHKSFMLFPVYIFVVYYGVKKNKITRMLLLGLTSALILSLLGYYLFDDIIWGSLFIRRVSFVPVQNSFFYYDFFSNNDLNFMSSSYLKWFFDKPIYSDRITTMIASFYYGKPFMSVNTGYLGEAYSNFGYLGMLFFSLILSIILKLMDSIAEKSKSIITTVLMASVVYIMVDSSLMVSLLSHGIIISLIIAYLYASYSRRKDNESINVSAK